MDRRTRLSGLAGLGSLALLALAGPAAAQFRPVGPLAPLGGAGGAARGRQTITIRTDPMRPGATETRITIRDTAGPGAPGPVTATAAAPGTRTTRITIERERAPGAVGTIGPTSPASGPPVDRGLPGGAGLRGPRVLVGGDGAARDPGSAGVHPLLLGPRPDRSTRITVSDGSVPSGPVPITGSGGRQTVTIRTEAGNADLGILIVVD